MKVVFSKTAEAKLEEIGDYIARDNARRSVTFVRELRGRAQTIGTLPRAFRLVPRYEHYGIRLCPHGNYLIFYRVVDDHVFIVRILHGARDYEELLFPSG